MVTKERVSTRDAAARTGKEYAEEFKKEQARKDKEEIDKFRGKAEKVEEYFFNITDEELLGDLRKARFDFYRLIKIIILKEG